jgi:hypothetical protein
VHVYDRPEVAQPRQPSPGQRRRRSDLRPARQRGADQRPVVVDRPDDNRRVHPVRRRHRHGAVRDARNQLLQELLHPGPVGVVVQVFDHATQRATRTHPAGQACANLARAQLEELRVGGAARRPLDKTGLTDARSGPSSRSRPARAKSWSSRPSPTGVRPRPPRSPGLPSRSSPRTSPRWRTPPAGSCSSASRTPPAPRPPRCRSQTTPKRSSSASAGLWSTTPRLCRASSGSRARDRRRPLPGCRRPAEPPRAARRHRSARRQPTPAALVRPRRLRLPAPAGVRGRRAVLDQVPRRGRPTGPAGPRWRRGPERPWQVRPAVAVDRVSPARPRPRGSRRPGRCRRHVLVADRLPVRVSSRPHARSHEPARRWPRSHNVHRLRPVRRRRPRRPQGAYRKSTPTAAPSLRPRSSSTPEPKAASERSPSSTT